MSNLISVFPTLIYKATFPREFSESEKVSYREVIDDNIPNKRNLISKDTYVLNREGLKEIREFIQVHLNQYTYQVLKTDMKQKFYITTSWMNLTKPQMSHHLHAHPNSIVSGVFYFETIPDDKLVFKNPTRTILQSFVTEYRPSTEYNILADSLGISVQNRTLLLFPSDLHHEVFKNESESERISLSFNTFIKGKLADNVNELVL